MLATTTPLRKPLQGVSNVEPSTYLTDGRSLFRVIRGFREPAKLAYALLEDCRTLDTFSFGPGELYEMGLEVVRAGRC